jgi:hypothetical protein
MQRVWDPGVRRDDSLENGATESEPAKQSTNKKAPVKPALIDVRRAANTAGISIRGRPAALQRHLRIIRRITMIGLQHHHHGSHLDPAV